MTHVVGVKGQIVISKEIRDKLGIRPGWRAIQSVVDNQVLIRFLPPEHERSLAGILREKCQIPYDGDEESAWPNTARKEWLGE